LLGFGRDRGDLLGALDLLPADAELPSRLADAALWRAARVPNLGTGVLLTQRSPFLDLRGSLKRRKLRPVQVLSNRPHSSFGVVDPEAERVDEVPAQSLRRLKPMSARDKAYLI